LRLLADQLARIREISVGALTRPGSNLADFYRELGDLFGVELKPHNRWGGFKLPRERWIAHLEGTLLRPVLLIDEAQEMQPSVLNELRLLSSLKFDSRILLTVVFAGDARFTTKLRRDELLPLGSRIRARLSLETAGRDDLLACLKHLQTQAGNPSLMTTELMKTLCDHALGNYRVLATMASELLAAAAQQELPQLDENLFLNAFGPTPSAPSKRVGSALPIQ
jgi:type II secretory pathway predicted ATPase ExeA